MKNQKLHDLVLTALMTAVVFVVTMFFKIDVPTPTGPTMIKLANAFVLLCGYLLGPTRGGLAAGLGSMLFDLMTPAYAPEAWITFIRFFLVAWLCGTIAHAGGANAKNKLRNIIACLVSVVFSTLLYATKGILELMIVGGSGFQAAFVANLPKFALSPITSVVTITVSLALLPALQLAMERALPQREATQTK